MLHRDCIFVLFKFVIQIKANYYNNESKIALQEKRLFSTGTKLVEYRLVEIKIPVENI